MIAFQRKSHALNLAIMFLQRPAPCNLSSEKGWWRSRLAIELTSKPGNLGSSHVFAGRICSSTWSVLTILLPPLDVSLINLFPSVLTFTCTRRLVDPRTHKRILDSRRRPLTMDLDCSLTLFLCPTFVASEWTVSSASPPVFLLLSPLPFASVVRDVL